MGRKNYHTAREARERFEDVNESDVEDIAEKCGDSVADCIADARDEKAACAENAQAEDSIPHKRTLAEIMAKYRYQPAEKECSPKPAANDAVPEPSPAPAQVKKDSAAQSKTSAKAKRKTSAPAKRKTVVPAAKIRFDDGVYDGMREELMESTVLFQSEIYDKFGRISFHGWKSLATRLDLERISAWNPEHGIYENAYYSKRLIGYGRTGLANAVIGLNSRNTANRRIKK